MATGSPLPPVNTPGTDKEYVIAECNNVSLSSNTHIGKE